MPKIIEPEASRFDDPTVADFKAFVGLKRQIDDLTKMQNEIKTRLVEAVEKYGDTDDKGHIWYDVPDAVDGYKGMQRQRRVSQKLDIDAALKLLDGTPLADRCLKMVPSLDEDEVMACMYEGLLTEEDVDTMYPKTVTWAFIPVKK
jgi:hypothetical protein